MTKSQAVKKISKAVKTAMASLTKEVNGILKSADMWYCIDDLLLSREELHAKNDRNGDQLLIDFAASFITGEVEISPMTEKMLWTEKEIKDGKQMA